MDISRTAKAKNVSKRLLGSIAASRQAPAVWPISRAPSALKVNHWVSPQVSWLSRKAQCEEFFCLWIISLEACKSGKTADDLLQFIGISDSSLPRTPSLPTLSALDPLIRNFLGLASLSAQLSPGFYLLRLRRRPFEPLARDCGRSTVHERGYYSRR